jgi:ribose 5-phosphate isomerase B
MTNTIVIASDHAGVELKDVLKIEAQALGFEITDLGTNHSASVDYPDYAQALCEWLKNHADAKGVLICGSGIGMSISANRHSHIRAALCNDGLSATLTRKHNDANVLCLGARLIGVDVAKETFKQFLTTPFDGGRHQKRIDKL